MPPLFLASVTDFFLDPIVNWGTDFISSTGLPAVFVLMTLESACLPVPSEAIMLFARIDLLERNKLIHISPKHLKQADDWFARHGDATVFFSRMLPIVRTFISLPAGVAKMPFWRFTAYTLAGCIPWVLMLALIGKSVGENWEEWRDHLHYLDYLVVIAVVVGIAYFLNKRH